MVLDGEGKDLRGKMDFVRRTLQGNQCREGRARFHLKRWEVAFREEVRIGENGLIMPHVFQEGTLKWPRGGGGVSSGIILGLFSFKCQRSKSN